MKKIFRIAPILLLAACSVEEPAVVESNFYYPEEVTASIDDYSSKPETKVYLDESLKVLWTNDDRISLFNKYTYNKEYRFSGRTGTNSGVFKEVSSGEVIVGNELDYVYAVYPYDELTEISNSGVITLDLPSEQAYAENSFGLGANTMVSATTNTELLFKNLCGYVVLKLYGDGVSVSSITLKGNNGEVLAGTADITAAVGSTPTLSFWTTGTSDSITLNCATPVELGATAEDATIFWLVVPPMTFTQGFSITVTDPDGNTFEKSTSSSKEVVRNRPYRMGALEVVLETPQPNNVIYYTSTDGEIVKPTTADYFYGAPGSIDVFGANIVSNDYVDGQGIITFDDEVTFIGSDAFNQSSSNNLETITLPQSVSAIAPGAFYNSSSHLNHFYGKYSSEDGRCLIDDGRVMAFAPSGLTDYTLPEGIRIIGERSVESEELRTIVIPEGVTTIEDQAFYYSYNVESAILPQTLEYIGDRSIPFGSYSIPSGVIHIGILSGPYLADLNSTAPPEIVNNTFGKNSTYWIYVPQGSGDTYRTAWPDYASRIREKGNQPLNEIWYTTVDGSPITTIHENHNITANWKQKLLSNDNGKMVFDAPITVIGDFFEQSNVVSISFPDAMNHGEGQGIFLNCGSLEEVRFGEYCSIIPAYCFYGCDAIETVTLPPYVTKISSYLLYNCPALKSLTILATTPPKQYTLFSGTTNKETPIYVPAESVEAYKDSEDWSTYTDMIQAIPEE